MTTKQLVANIFSLFILVGVWQAITAAVVISYILIPLAAVLLILGTVALSHLRKEQIVEIRRNYTLSNFLTAVLTQVAHIGVYFMTANMSLLFCYLILIPLVWYFVFKLFTYHPEK